MSSKLFIQIIVLMIIGAVVLSGVKAVLWGSKCKMMKKPVCSVCEKKMARK